MQKGELAHRIESEDKKRKIKNKKEEIIFRASISCKYQGIILKTASFAMRETDSHLDVMRIDSMILDKFKDLI